MLFIIWFKWWLSNGFLLRKHWIAVILLQIKHIQFLILTLFPNTQSNLLLLLFTTLDWTYDIFLVCECGIFDCSWYKRDKWGEAWPWGDGELARFSIDWLKSLFNKKSIYEELKLCNPIEVWFINLLLIYYSKSLLSNW